MPPSDNQKNTNYEKYLGIIWGLFIPLSLFYAKLLYTEYHHVYYDPYGGTTPDFLAFWAASKMAVNGFAVQAFDQASLLVTQNEIFPATTVYLPWHNPPIFFLYLTPFGYMDFFPSYVIWVALTTLLCAFICAKLVSPAKLVLPAIFCTFPYYANFYNGQTSAFMAALWGGVALALLSKRPIVAGILVALMAYKPQYAVLIPIAFIAGREWKAFAAAAVGVILLIGITLIMYGADSWWAFREGSQITFDTFIQTRTSHEEYAKLYSIYGVLRYVGHLSYSVAMSLHVLIGFLCAVIVFIVWRDKKIPYEIKVGILILGGLLSSFYVYWHDFFILTIPVLLIFRTQTKDNMIPYENYFYTGIIFSTFLTNFFMAQVLFIPAIAIGYLLYKRYRYFKELDGKLEPVI